MSNFSIGTNPIVPDPTATQRLLVADEAWQFAYQAGVGVRCELNKELVGVRVTKVQEIRRYSMLKKPVYLVLVILLIAGCATESAGPGVEELRDKFSVEMPGYWEVVSFEVLASENYGTEVEPIYKSRFKAELKLREDTFEFAENKGDAVLISKVKDMGAKTEVYGLATSRLKGNSWSSEFQLETNPLPDLGQPRGFFKGRNVVIKGSAEERRLLEDLALQEEELRKSVLERMEKEAEFRRKQEEIRAREEEQSRKREIQRAEAQKELLRKKTEKLISIVSSDREYTGDCYGGTTWPFKIRFNRYDPDTGQIVGTLEWLTLSAIHEIRGRITGGKLNFEETKRIKKGNAILGTSYELEVDIDKNTMDGGWHGGGSGGSITIYLD